MRPPAVVDFVVVDFAGDAPRLLPVERAPEDFRPPTSAPAFAAALDPTGVTPAGVLPDLVLPDLVAPDLAGDPAAPVELPRPERGRGEAEVFSAIPSR